MNKTITGYHFTGDKLKNGEPIPKPGIWLKHDGLVEPCVSGLHCSEHPFDALKYAPGHLLHRVELRTDLLSHENPIDKWVGRERRILCTINAETLLNSFARFCALDVVHLWSAPEIVVRFLKTGDESIRDAAWDAAWAAARDAARDAAWDAARAAAWAAARGAAWAAARATAWDAARAAAWGAAWDAAWFKYRNQFQTMTETEFNK